MCLYVSFPLRSVSDLNVGSALKLNNLKIGEGHTGGTLLSSRWANFTIQTFPALSHDSRCMIARSGCIVATPADDAPRFGLCALRSRISRYTYATRDLLPMIMRGWKYALQEDEEEEMGPSPTAIERPLSIDVTATSSSMYPSYRCQTRCSTCSLKRG